MLNIKLVMNGEIFMVLYVEHFSEDRECKEDVNSKSEFTSIRSVPSVDREPPAIDLLPAKISLRLYPSVWFALSLMSLVGIVAVALHFLVNNTGDSASYLASPVVEQDMGEMALSNAPEAVETEEAKEAKAAEARNATFVNNIDQIAKNCARMVTAKNSFAVFEHGTCVLLIEPVADPVVAARSSLKILADPRAEFEVQSLDNNNYLIIFDKYLFCWMFADQLAKNKAAIIKDRRLGRSPSDTPKVRSLTDIEIRVGKLARLCLLEDSRKLNLKKIIRAKRPEQDKVRKEAVPADK